MKFEEVLPALREGKKITCSIIKNSGCHYIYYFDGTIFCDSGGGCLYLTDKAIIEIDDWEVVKTTKKVKLRDLTEEQYQKWILKNCDNYDDKCEGCPFLKVYCDRNPNIDDWWIRNKDLYSDKFLDQEVEIDE